MAEAAGPLSHPNNFATPYGSQEASGGGPCMLSYTKTVLHSTTNSEYNQRTLTRYREKIVLQSSRRRLSFAHDLTDRISGHIYPRRVSLPQVRLTDTVTYLQPRAIYRQSSVSLLSIVSGTCAQINRPQHYEAREDRNRVAGC